MCCFWDDVPGVSRSVEVLLRMMTDRAALSQGGSIMSVKQILSLFYCSLR